jgi:hypothetical protein
MRIGIGILRDHQTTGGDKFAHVVRFAFDDVRASGRLAHDLELIEERADGLPQGSRESVEAAFRRLDARGVVAVIGPGISDNGIIVRDLADDVRLPCINWTGGDVTRGEWMFHYQLGSLEEEPAFLALHLAARGRRRIALVHDDSLVGRRYVEFFEDAAARFGLEIVLLTESTRDVRRLRAANPDAILYLGLWFAARELGVALAASDWRPPVFSNSALMYGHASPDWRREWDGWCYVDAYSDRNPIPAGRARAARRSRNGARHRRRRLRHRPARRRRRRLRAVADARVRPRGGSSASSGCPRRSARPARSWASAAGIAARSKAAISCCARGATAHRSTSTRHSAQYPERRAPGPSAR